MSYQTWGRCLPKRSSSSNGRGQIEPSYACHREAQPPASGFHDDEGAPTHRCSSPPGSGTALPCSWSCSSRQQEWHEGDRKCSQLPTGRGTACRWGGILGRETKARIGICRSACEYMHVVRRPTTNDKRSSLQTLNIFWRFLSKPGLPWGPARRRHFWCQWKDCPWTEHGI